MASSLALILARLSFFSMVEESSSTTGVVLARRSTVLNETDTSPNLIVLNVNAQAQLKLIATMAAPIRVSPIWV